MITNRPLGMQQQKLYFEAMHFNSSIKDVDMPSDSNQLAFEACIVKVRYRDE